MRIAALTLLSATLVSAWAADIDTKALLERVRQKVLVNARRAPRYTCREEVERQEFLLAFQKSKAPFNPAAVCDILRQEQPGKSARLKLVDSDRARLDVMLAGRSELFSWPGERSFGAKTPSDLIGGGFSNNGDFAAFLTEVFAPKQASFQYAGSCGAHDCVRFTYDVPIETSRYLVKTAEEQATVAFGGDFDVDSRSGELIRLSVVAGGLEKELKGVCETRVRMTYTARIEGGGYLAPESAESEFLSTDGSYSVNRVSYVGCRRYTADSVLSFAADSTAPGPSAKPPALPAPGASLRLRLASAIDSETNFAGDTVVAALDRPVEDSEHAVIPSGTVVRGHLAQLKKVYGPHPALVIALRLDTIVLHDIPVPITLEARGHTDDHGRAMFRFAGEKVVVGREFTSVWHVR